MFSSIVATVYEILALYKFYQKKKNLTLISLYSKPIIVLFAFLPLEAAFYKFSTLLLITFDPIARFHLIFFKLCVVIKAHSPKGFLSL